MQTVTNNKEKTFSICGLSDEGKGVFSTKGSAEPAHLDIPISLPAGTLRIRPEVSAYVDLGEAQYIAPPIEDESIPPHPVDDRHTLRSLVKDSAGKARIVNNMVEMVVVNADGQPLSNPIPFSRRVPQTFRFAMPAAHYIGVQPGAQEIVLRLVCQGQIKRLCRVRASVEVQTVEAPAKGARRRKSGGARA